MKKIVIGTTEINVLSLTPYAYMQGKGEKVLQIRISAEGMDFESLRAALEGAEEPVKYYEDDTLLCEYAGYGVFEAQYAAGEYSVELHKVSLEEQMSVLLNANEQLTGAVAALEEARTVLEQTTETLAAQNETLAAQNETLAEQNALLESCILEMSEIIYAE